MILQNSWYLHVNDADCKYVIELGRRPYLMFLLLVQYVSFVLHAHLPFIHHPESDDYLEESWLYEAISETYIPLLTNFQKISR